MSNEIQMLPLLPGIAPIPGMGASFLPERTSVEYTATVAELEPIPSRFPWMATRTAPNKFTIAKGKVYGVSASVKETPEELLVDTDADGWTVWVKITHASLVITEAVLGQGATVPADTDTIMYRPVVEFYRISGGGDPYLAIGQIENTHIRITTAPTASGGASEDHPWKATAGAVTPAEGEGLNPTQVLDIAGGNLYTQVAFDGVFVAAATFFPETGTAYLKVSRDDSTRALDTQEIVYLPSTEMATDTSYEQYIPLAQVTVEDGLITGILQLKFEDICLFEDMVVINGEFRFIPLAMHGRGPYELPPP